MEMMNPLNKCVIPVAGLGTRFLPATKAQPKEMLPLVDKPIIQYVVEEAARCGFNSIVLVTGRGKQAIENHFDVAFELEETLFQRLQSEELKLVREITKLARMTYVRQGLPLGLGHAVLSAKDAVGNDPFALLLGDDVFDDREAALQTLVDVYMQTGKAVVGVQEVPLSHVSRYGIVSAPQTEEGWWEVNEIIEKPGPAEAPSRWAVVGRYILTPQVMNILENLPPGACGEYQLTDALAVLAADKKLVAAPIRSKRYDTGNKIDFLRANLDFALRRPGLRDELSDLIIQLASQILSEQKGTPLGCDDCDKGMARN